MMTRTAAALLLSCLALAGCSFDGTGFGDQPATTQTSTGEASTSTTTTTGDSTTTDAPTTSTTGGDLCGDYQKDADEQCDVGPNGNAVCTPDCKYNVCGDDYVGSGEDCDGDVPGCVDCQLASCGNGEVDPGEQCDDGNDDDTDACLGTCKSASCGDTFVQVGVEQCDDGNDLDTDACVAGCLNAGCGDGLVWDGNEFCDDGNQVDDDTCPNTCASPGCGDGILTAPEECDDDNTDNNDGCSATCKTEKCGDGVQQIDEECDNGETQNADEAACTSECKTNICGDGKQHMGVEECDDGNDIDTDACTNACDNAICGDNIVGPGEQCDDGNNIDTDACTNACEAATCGDSIVGPGEQCDDGNGSDFDACRNDCILNTCGDGILNPGVETCDHGPLNDDDDDNTMKSGACKKSCTARNGFLAFVTSKVHVPKTGFATIAAADALCAAAAASEMGALKIRGGTWKAWLHDGVTGPAMNFHQSAQPYFTLLNATTTLIADDWADLIDGDLAAAIDVTETNLKLPGNGNDCDDANVVWTGIKTDNAASTHCMAWDNNLMANDGQAGTIRQSDGKWTEACKVTCNESARLYCFEQPSG